MPTETTSVAVRPTPLRTDRALGLVFVVLGLGAALVAVLGPLVLGLLDYHASSGAVAQVAGGDLVALVLVAPVSVTAGVLLLRGRPEGAVLGLGPAAFGVYVWFQLGTGGDPHRYPGNLATFFPLLLALFLLAAGALLLAWRVGSALDLPQPDVRVDRLAGGFLLVVATFLVVGLHLPGLLTLWRGSPTEEYLADPGIFWVVKIMDLGLVVPLLVVTGVGLLRRARWVGMLRYAVTGWAALLGSAVAGMAVVMQLTDAPGASPALTVAFGTFAAVALVLAVLVHRPLLRGQARGGNRWSTTSSTRPPSRVHVR